MLRRVGKRTALELKPASYAMAKIVKSRASTTGTVLRSTPAHYYTIVGQTRQGERSVPDLFPRRSLRLGYEHAVHVSPSDVSIERIAQRIQRPISGRLNETDVAICKDGDPFVRAIEPVWSLRRAPARPSCRS